MSKRTRLILVALVVVVAAVALVAIRPGGTSKPSQPAAGAPAPESSRSTPGSAPVPTRRTRSEQPALVRVVDGRPLGGVKVISARKGEVIRFSVRSDVADEVHVHGYDLSKDVTAGDQVAFAFPATIDGVFEVELEDRGELIASLRVQP